MSAGTTILFTESLETLVSSGFTVTFQADDLVSIVGHGLEFLLWGPLSGEELHEVTRSVMEHYYGQ